jgi:hypothetical protein
MAYVTFGLGYAMSNKSLLSIVITNYNTLNFVKLSLFAIKKLTLNQYVVLINDNGSRPSEIVVLKKMADENSNIKVFLRKTSYKEASYAHAEALDLMIEKVETPYTVILDSDCTFLLRGWDQRLINCINDTVKIVGTSLPKGRSCLKPYDFPFQFAVLFETETYRQLDISCMPREIKKGEDTCWQWKPKFVQGGYKGKILITKNTRDYKQGPFGDLVGVEEYYMDDGELIASHFGRGSSGGAAKYCKWLKIPVVSGYVKRYYGNIEKKKWISKCYKIINEQFC